MAKKILVANWKNHPNSLREASRILVSMSRKSRTYKKLHTFVAPPLPYFEIVSERCGTYMSLAVQDLPAVSEDTETGAVSLTMLKSFGVRLAIVGHSERRAKGETAKVVREKIEKFIKSGIPVLLCIGESERDIDGAYFEFIREELKSALDGLRKESLSKIYIAYEPIWAIGRPAAEAMSPLDLAQMTIFIKKVLTDMFGRKQADKVSILYGGSVEESNAEALAQESGVSGFLVGHDSLNPKDFAIIAEHLSKAK